MIAGHFATALVPWSRLAGAPLWLLLLAAQFPDLLWFTLATVGLEPTEPASFLDVALSKVRVEMIYSHSGLGALGVALLFAALVHVRWRRAPWSVACGALVLGHWLCDLLSGFSHEIAAAGSPKVGFNLYATHPAAAVWIEAAFAGALVAWYLQSERAQGRPLTRRSAIALFAVFVGGALMFLPTASTSLRDILGG